MIAGRRIAAAVLAAVLLAGCATPLTADVTRFHRLGDGRASLAGQRIAVVPAAGQADGLEFEAYADQVRRALVAQGLVASEAGRADLIASLRYAEVRVAAPAAPSGPHGGISIGSGVGGGFGGGLSVGIGIGFPIGGGGSAAPARSRYELWLNIDRRGTAAEGAGRLFEAHAVSDDRVDGLAAAVPALVRAVFADFPGANGETLRVEVPVQ